MARASKFYPTPGIHGGANLNFPGVQESPDNLTNFQRVTSVAIAQVASYILTNDNAWVISLGIDGPATALAWFPSNQEVEARAYFVRLLDQADNA